MSAIRQLIKIQFVTQRRGFETQRCNIFWSLKPKPLNNSLSGIRVSKVQDRGFKSQIQQNFQDKIGVFIDAFYNFFFENDKNFCFKIQWNLINIFNLDNEANSSHRFGVKNHSFKIHEVQHKSHTITTHD